MGDNFLRQQAKNFRKRRDLAIKEMDIPSLFKRPEIVDTIYKAKPCENENLKCGEALYAMPGKNMERVSLVRCGRKVGYLEGDSAKALVNTLCDSSTPGIIPVRIINVANLSGIAEAQITADRENG